MKKVFTILAAVLLTASVFAQSPEKMSYQAVVRDASDNLVTNAVIGMQISILQGSVTGTTVYVETQTPSTNVNGLLTIEIGTGTATDDFSVINWANGLYFIKTETDPAGGTNYTITGISQLLSVPFALHAKTAESISGTIEETDPVFGISVANGITGTDTANWNNKLENYIETDGDLTNEIQRFSVSFTGDTLYISAGNWVIIPGISAAQSVTDYDENVYPFVTIGEQIWMAENLATTSFNDSSEIPLVSDSTTWFGLTTPAYCWYNNDSETFKPGNGALYNWYTIETEMLCPAGWHIPSDDEWMILEQYLGMSESDAQTTGFRGTDEGKKIKATSGWNQNGNGTNESGFSAIPSGVRTNIIDDTPQFFAINNTFATWTSTSYSNNQAYLRELDWNTDKIGRFGVIQKKDGLSVRCIKD
jgi:uncharacterized protein (TIGR02145 family)